jgi:hypothetical protein
MSTGNFEKPGVPPEAVHPSLPFHEALQGLLTLTQLLRSLPSPDGSGATPTIVVSASGIEVRMGDHSSTGSSTQTAGERPEWCRRIEEGLASLREATAALTAAFNENVTKVDATLASQQAAIDSVRSALEQNEQLMESMVELMAPSEFTLQNPGEFANIS